jgi:ADP-ribose pyrophosphatase YjhB (NUDIX family)
VSHIRVSARALIVEDGSVLLVEFDDESGLHYNLPGGGAEPGESLLEALKRETEEEASVEIEVGPLLFVVEYEPQRNAQWAGPVHALSFIFECRLSGGAKPAMPDRPDPNQTAVKWIKLSDLDAVELLPHIADRIVAYAQSGAAGAAYLQEPIWPERVQRYL